MKYLLSKLISYVLFALSSHSLLASATGLSQEEFEQLRKENPNVIVLDVRTPEEYKEGFIEGAINIPHTDLQKILAEVNKEDTIVMYCRSGRRVGLVADALAEKGFNKLHSLDGDITDWLAKGKPIVKPEQK